MTDVLLLVLIYKLIAGVFFFCKKEFEDRRFKFQVFYDISLRVLVSKTRGLSGKKDTKVLNMYNIFNLQKRRCLWIACT
jgi:hypothetical protein